MFETKVAYLKFKFNVTVEVTRADEPSEIEAKIEGTPLGVVGRLTAKSITRLEDAGNETKVTYSVESTLAGKLGSIGQPVLRSKAKDMEKQFATTAARRVRGNPAGGSMIPFDLAEPTSLAAAIKLLNPDDPTIRPIAGGTALMLMMKAGVFNPEKLISLRKIESKYSSISAGADGLAHRRDDDARHARALGRRAESTRRSSPAPCGRCRTCACATSRPSAARWPTAIRTWTCRRC